MQELNAGRRGWAKETWEKRLQGKSTEGGLGEQVREAQGGGCPVLQAGGEGWVRNREDKHDVSPPVIGRREKTRVFHLGAMGERLLHELIKAVAGEDAEKGESDVRHEVPDTAKAAGVLADLSRRETRPAGLTWNRVMVGDRGEGVAETRQEGRRGRAKEGGGTQRHEERR